MEPMFPWIRYTGVSIEADRPLPVWWRRQNRSKRKHSKSSVYLARVQ
jgi:hypothetical protein